MSRNRQPDTDAPARERRPDERVESLDEARARIASLELETERLRFAMAGSGLGFWDWNVVTNEIVVNAEWAEMIGYRAEELDLTLSTWEKLIHPEDVEQVYADLQAHLEGRTEYYENAHRLRTKAGEWRWILDRGKVFEWTPAGEPLRAAGTHRDIHREKLLEERLKALALRDPLTGLANRRYLESMFGHAVAQAQRSSGELGIVYLDLDGFKPINDRLGHEAGDAVLCEIARRLTDAVRGQDVVARLGGDEFCVLVTQTGETGELVGLGRRILGLVAKPMALGEETARLGCSIGVARFPYHGTTLDGLLKVADDAMYEAKRAGKGEVVLAA